MLERENANTKNFATISYVSIPYGVIPDSTVTVTDDDVQAYVNAHKKLFKQEAGRMISYVTFSQLPRAEDSAKTLKEVADLKAAFEADSNNTAFLAKNNSRLPYTDEFVAKAKLPTTKADSIIKLNPGAVYGPYLDYGSYVLAKYIGNKSVLDSIKCRHILIKPEGALNDSTAHKLADSIAASIKSGVDFNTLETLYSKDEAAHRDKGVMTFDIATIKNPQGFSPEFAAFLLNEAGETKKVVKTSFGWHYIEIMEKKNNPGYKVAFLAREIETGENSLNIATQDAIKLSSTKKSKDFEAYLQKNGIIKTTLPNLIKETDDQVGALTGARQLVNWVYNASVGDVSEPFLIDDNQVVAVLEKVSKEGTQDVKTARPLAERAIKNKKIAETIIKKITPTATLESAAAAYNQPIQTAGADSSVIYNTTIINGLNEPKLVGAAFNKENQSKASAPIEGASGVYLVKVSSIGSKPADTPAETTQKIQSQTMTLRQQVTANWYEGLKNQATIKDRRGKVNY
jgi:peptidyl-prolyl cis-trans isomerase D